MATLADQIIMSWRKILQGLQIAGVVAAPWPDTPFTTTGRDIKTASGQNFIYYGVNWPGQGVTMLPEGLQYSSISNIVTKVKDNQFNSIRLTYAIEMIDDIYSHSPNQSLKNTLVNALGQTNGTAVLASILKNNPQFTQDTTRMQVFDAVAAECDKQHIYVHLDNHVSKAEWCCSLADGNGWFQDTYFDVANWYRGLGYMADHAKSWPAFASMSLRNELRPAFDQPNSAAPYDWQSWKQYAVPATGVINGNNSSPLIFLSGLNYDTDLSGLVNSTDTIDLASFSYANKLVFELHNYQNSATQCDDIKSTLYNGGYGAMDVYNKTFYNHAPVVMTEFGFDQTDGSDAGVYAQCIRDFLINQPGGPGGSMQWVFSGSYYDRQGRQDDDETWAILNHNWSGVRNQTVIDSFNKPFANTVLA